VRGGMCALMVPAGFAIGIHSVPQIERRMGGWPPAATVRTLERTGRALAGAVDGRSPHGVCPNIDPVLVSH